MARPIGTLGTIPTITVGGVVFTDLSGLIILQATYAPAINTNSTARVFSGTAGYQVTAGKTYTIYAISIANNVTAALTSNVFYSDNDMGRLTATAPTNPKYYASGNDIVDFTCPVQTILYCQPTKWAIPATKYVGIIATGLTQGVMQFYGYET